MIDDKILIIIAIVAVSWAIASLFDKDDGEE